MDAASIKNILSITALNQAAKSLLETLGIVWVEGEISNFTRAPSGHLYFSLKDEKAQVRAAYFRGHLRGPATVFHNGMKVLARARVSIYEARGDYQLIIEHMEEAGLGILQRAFEMLKAKLAQEGLFSPEHKKPIPSFIQTLGIITSPTGAALQDMLHTLERRFPLMRVIVYPTLVQGKEASAQIVRAIEWANQRGEADCLIVARGGGSLEDLFAFNEEIVARAIYASKIPIISGVGHETDVTIADFVADLRAATPTAAAELASPDQVALKHRLNLLTQKLMRTMEHLLLHHTQQLMLLNKSLVHPGDVLRHWMQRVDLLAQRLSHLMLQQCHQRDTLVTALLNRLAHCHPRIAVEAYDIRLQTIHSRLLGTMETCLTQKAQTMGGLGRELQALSPLAVLDRGYSITMTEDHRTVTSVKDVAAGDRLVTRVRDGEMISIVL